MNMKKVLSVVLALMLAISAMAVTTFADDWTINLSSANTATGNAVISTVEFTIPVWPEYGYATSGKTITFNLPSKLDADGEEVYNYYITAGGVNYALGTAAEQKDSSNGSFKTKEYVVTFGTLAHSWDGLTTEIPQSVLVGDNNTLKLVGQFQIKRSGNGYNDYEQQRINAKSFKLATGAGDLDWNYNNAGRGWFSFIHNTSDWGETLVPSYDVYAKADDGTMSYSWYWNPVDGTDIYANDANSGSTYVGKWDATLANKAAILGADTAKVVLKLDKTLVGNYYFGVKAQFDDNTYYEGYENFNSWWLGQDTYGGTYAAFVEITEPTDTIVIEVPVDALYSARYGIWNESLEIVPITDAHDSMKTTIAKIVETTQAAGTMGSYSWTVKSDWSTSVERKVVDKIYFQGQEVSNHEWNNIWWAGNNPWDANLANSSIVSFDLVLSTAAVEEEPAEDVEIEAPVESETEETEEDNVVVEDENPTTGVALALVPAAIALAVVALKRR